MMSGVPALMDTIGARFEHFAGVDGQGGYAKSRQTAPTFATLVQEFFTDYMVQQRALSPRTVASYRDTFVLLLRFAEETWQLPPHGMTIADLNARFLADFLNHLEVQRHNSVRSRNVRLAAVRAFVKFAPRRDPRNLGVIENALAVPMKRFERKMVGFLPREQMMAVIDAATDTWIGQRDRLLLTLMFNTGARVSEIIGVRVVDLLLGPTNSIRLHGKGRKQRSLPLWKSSAARSMHAKQRTEPHEAEERGDRRQERGVAEDPEGTARPDRG